MKEPLITDARRRLDERHRVAQQIEAMPEPRYSDIMLAIDQDGNVPVPSDREAQCVEAQEIGVRQHPSRQTKATEDAVWAASNGVTKERKDGGMILIVALILAIVAGAGLWGFMHGVLGVVGHAAGVR